MAPYYKLITSSSSVLPLDKSLLESMEKSNEEELLKLDQRLEEANKTEGESEISDALKARANYLTRIGDRVSLVRLHIPSRVHIGCRSAQSRHKSSRWKRHQVLVRG